jgi:hypothetical protein
LEANDRQRVHRRAGIAEVDLLERHPAATADHRQIDGIGGIDDVGHHVQVLEDPVEEGQGRSQLHRYLQQLPDREAR